MAEHDYVMSLLRDARGARGLGHLPARIALGRLVVTQGVQDLVPRARVIDCVAQHEAGMYGLLPPEDQYVNDANVGQNRGRVMSAWAIDELKGSLGYGENTLWIITQGEGLQVDAEPGVTATTILLPSEY